MKHIATIIAAIALSFSGLFVAGTASASSQLGGLSAVQPTMDSNPQGTAQAYQYVASRTGTTHTISFYVDSANTASAGLLGIYRNNGGDPGARLGRVAFTPHSGWNTVTLSGVSIVRGHRYWLAEMGTSGVLKYRDHIEQEYSLPYSETRTGMPLNWVTGHRWSSGSASFFVSG